jgi:hypothetical protein
MGPVGGIVLLLGQKLKKDQARNLHEQLLKK